MAILGTNVHRAFLQALCKRCKLKLKPRKVLAAERSFRPDYTKVCTLIGADASLELLQVLYCRLMLPQPQMQTSK